MENSSPKQETKRRHVTTACVACRESKVKCNGATPICSSCLYKGKECRYEAREDKRKISLRVAIELLSNRVQQLSQVIEGHGLQLPSMAQDDERTLSGILQTLQLPHVQSKPRQGRVERESGATNGSPAAPRLERGTERLESSIGAPAPAPAPTMSDMPAADVVRASSAPAMRGLLELANAAGNIGGIIPNQAGWDWNIQPEPIPQESMVHPGYMSTGVTMSGFNGNIQTPSQQQSSVSGSALSCPSMEMDDTTSSPGSVDELVDQLSDRVGTLYIRPGGHIRFYGSTSNFNLLETSAADVSMNVHWNTRNDGPEHLGRLELNKDVPLAVEEHLMDLYFTWQDPSFHVVDRKMYEEAKVLWCDKMEDTSYYSEALRNAICALGAAFDSRHHPTFVTFPRSLADFFADRAKALLEIELDSPCVATIQTLVLLSAHDIGCGRDARGWLFSGMAMRLSFNLALHHDLRPYIAKGVVSPAEADLRRTVFWAVFVVDHVWSFYLGQPFRMSMKGVSLDKPGGESGPEMPGQCTPNAAMAQSFPPTAECIDDVCRYQALLFEAMAPLSDTLYGSQTTSKSALQELNQQTVTKLIDWKEGLPVELRVDLSNREATYLPHVILLQMQYHQSIIYAHRPWMSKSHIQLQPPQGPGPGHARTMCMDSASSVAQLLRLYEEQYTLRRINIQAVAITFSAALVLIFATVSHYRPERKDEILADLSTCFRALDELASSWDTAKRAREFLLRLQRHWARQVRSDPLASARNETASTRSGSGFSSARKRPRVSIRPSDQSPPVRLRAETASSLQEQGEYWTDGSNSAAVDFGMDLDFDWMLATSMEGMTGNWGNVFSVQSSHIMPG